MLFGKEEPIAVRADLFEVPADLLIGRQVPKPRGAGPTGRMRKVFESASQLPRRGQQRIVDVVDALVAQNSASEKR